MLGAFYEYEDLCSIIILQSDEVIALRNENNFLHFKKATRVGQM